MIDQEKFVELLRNVMLDDEKSAQQKIKSLKPEDIELQNRSGHTLLHMMIINDKDDLAMALIEKATPEQLTIKDKSVRDPIHLAIDAGNRKLVEAMAKKLGPETMAKYSRELKTYLQGTEVFDLFPEAEQWKPPVNYEQAVIAGK